MIYLDNAATTPVDPRVAQAMNSYLTNVYGNPSSKFNQQAEESKKFIIESRQAIASFLSCNPGEILFTSGASESNNLVIKGICFPQIKAKQKVHIITSKVEHKATLNCCKFLEGLGVQVTYLDVDKFGRVSVEDIKSSITEDTKLVSLIWGNNEIGSLNPIETIGEFLYHENIKFHVDATQVYGKLSINLSEIFIDFMSFSAHKIYGPKGIGGLFIRRDKYDLLPDLEPLIHGGQQEFGLRAGTESTHNIVGFKVATEIASEEMDEYIDKILNLERKFIERLKVHLPSVQINSPIENKIPGIINVIIPGLNSELFLKWASSDYALSTGSACALGEASHVIDAIGPAKHSRDILRISIGKFNDESILELTDALSNYLDEYSL